MSRFRVFLLNCSLVTCCLLTVEVCADEPQVEKFTQQQLDDFENKVRPILVRRCNECHADGESEGGLSMQSRKAMLKGGDTGSAFVSGDPESSLLIKAIHYDDVYEMPPESKLPDEEIAILEDWIRDRAPWPDHSDVEVASAGDGFDIIARKESHWCWQEVSPPLLPAVGSPSKVIDYFLEKKLSKNGIEPNGAAGRTALLRRISFDLTGLPPSQDFVQKYVIEESMQTEEVIDAMLASPHYGERWARHWMDLFRYAETHGHEFDYPINDAWRYRDYLIRAFNADLPYDQFITEHIAGDLIDSPRQNPEAKFNESVLATGFWFLGEATHGPVDSKENEATRVDNQIDVMCRSFIGLTVACARCHDHKFDAISTKDYYALAGFLQSSRRHRVVVDHGLEFATAAKEIAPIRKELAALTDDFRRRIAATDPKVAAERLAGLRSHDGENVVKNKLRKAMNAEMPQLLSQRLQTVLATQPVKNDNVEFSLEPSNWNTDGLAFAGRNEAPLICDSELQLVQPHVISSASNGLPFAGLAHSSTFEIKQKFIHIRLKAKNARVELVVDGFKMHEFNAILFKGLIHKNVNHDQFKWITIGKELYLHFGSRAWIEVDDAGEGYFAIDRVVFSDDRGPPKEDTPELAARWESQRDSKPAERSDATLQMIIDSMSGPHSPEVMSWVLRHELDGVFDAADVASEMRKRMNQIEEFTSALPSPSHGLTMTEGFPENEFVFIRGNHKMKGDVAPRQFLSAIVGDDRSMAESRSSGRLQLAQQITNPKNPLTSRVIVNRVWHHLYGRGIVPSVDNFGVLGELPSHPELLDHLASEFVNDGWSIKRLVRKLMLTDAYQRSSKPTADGNERDPQNLLLYRANVRRLQGEAIRDSILSSSGTLDARMFGPSVAIHITPFMRGRGAPGKKGKIDGKGRRSIYIETRRNFLSPMMLAFDTPIPFNAIGKRSVSNVPAQALILMNDPFVLGQAEKFAARVVSESDSNKGRIEFVYRSAFSRMPLSEEVERAESFLKSQAKRLGVDAGSPEVWQDFCHVVFNIKEFIYLN